MVKIVNKRRDKNMKTLNDALQFFANQIWNHGESKEVGCQCIIPFSYNYEKELTLYEQASKIVYNKMKATHFDRHWKERGKVVMLRFYRGESFGAELNIKFIKEEIVILKG